MRRRTRVFAAAISDLPSASFAAAEPMGRLRSHRSQTNIHSVSCPRLLTQRGGAFWPDGSARAAHLVVGRAQNQPMDTQEIAVARRWRDRGVSAWLVRWDWAGDQTAVADPINRCTFA